MLSPVDVLHDRLQAAIEAALGPDFAAEDPVLRSSAHGDLQANAAMALAKRASRSPRDIAQAIVDHLDLTGLCEPAEIAGPGFLNLTFTGVALGAAAEGLLADDRLGVPMQDVETVVIDYSSPTLAKELHVGHLRSTIIGDALARVVGFVGHRVVRQNHYGDWGTQFGMLIEHMLDQSLQRDDLSVRDLNEFYEEANARFNTDDAFKERARAQVVALQRGEPAAVALWRQFVDASVEHAEQIYAALGVGITTDDARAESSFNDDLDDVAAELERKGLTVIDDGALCVFPPGFLGREGEPFPLMVRKADGGYGYQAFDLAAIRHRFRDLGARRLIYVVDDRQLLHLSMVIAVAGMAGWIPEGGRAEHVVFGKVLHRDGTPIKTREGGSVKLNDLLDEAVARAAAVVADKAAQLPPDEQARVARQVGVGAVKYADLSSDRVKDYIFDWERMLAFDGNTAPYLQYAHARIRSIFRRAEIDPDGLAGSKVAIGEPAEHELLLILLGLPEVVGAVVDHLQPHRLCTWLFELAQAFTAFYETCPVLKADDDATRASRLALCALTARALALGLDLLGIEAPDRM